MFEKYNIDELFIARIEVKYPEHPIHNVIHGALARFMSEGYSYSTIVRKNGDNYIDLENPESFIRLSRDYRTKSHTIIYMEPLSNYYTRDGKKRISKRKAIRELKENYDEFHQKSLNLSKEK